MTILVTGGSGFLGAVIQQYLRKQTSTMVVNVSRSVDAPSPTLLYDAQDPGALLSDIRKLRPSRIIHAAAMSSLVACEQDPISAQQANVDYTALLVEAARRVDAHLTYISTDLVFDGTRAPPGGHTEESLPLPASVYASTKRAGEVKVSTLDTAALVRLSVLIGRSPSGVPGTLGWMEDAFLHDRPLDLFYDEFRTPLWVDDAARALVEVSLQGLSGVWHLGGPERLSRVELGKLVAQKMCAPTNLIREKSRYTVPSPPLRPEDASLCSDKLFEKLGWRPANMATALTVALRSAEKSRSPLF